MKFVLTLSILTFLSFQSLSQRALIEEFTNVNLENATESSTKLDSIYSQYPYNFCVIRYHTDTPSGDPFNTNVTAAVNSRLTSIGGIDSFPTTVVDGLFRQSGASYLGATSNTTRAFLDSITYSKEAKISFFGLVLNFSDDFKEVIGSSGMVTTNNSSIGVKLYRALVEKVVNVTDPIGPDGQVQFTNVFRGWITNGRGETVPGNGSIHGWSTFAIPPSVIDLNNLQMVVFATDYSGWVLDCVTISAGVAPSYSLKSTNITAAQSTLCDSIVIPSILIKNTGVNSIEGVAIKTQFGDSSYIDFRYDVIDPAEEKTYVLDQREILLPRGTHFIDVTVDYILNSPTKGNISSSNGPIRYLVGRAHSWEDVGFEDLPEDSFGPITVRSKVDAALKVVSADDIGSSEPVGAYGLSEHALMVDCWTWPWDDEDAGNSYLVDNKNFAYLYFDHFPLDNIKQPVLKFDVASGNKANHKCIEVAGRPFTCTRNPGILRTLTGNDILSATPNITDRYTPKANDWRSYSVDLNSLKDSKETHLRLKFTNHVDYARPNAFYIDNIRIESNEKICFEGDAILKTQADIDSFIITYPDCNVIDGDLCIGYCNQDSLSDIENLNGLQNINTINGSLRIINNRILSEVSGLNKLRELNGKIDISNNDSLKTLAGINSLTIPEINGLSITNNASLEVGLFLTVTRIKGSLEVKNNPLLGRFPLYVTSVDNGIIFSGNPKLWKFNYSYPLESVNGNIVLEGLEDWNSFIGFDKLSNINGSLTIKDCGIISLYGLHNLESIAKDFTFVNNFNVESLGFLLKTKSILGKIMISDNERLKDISILDNINYEDLGSLDSTQLDFILSDNDSLEICNFQLLCRLVTDNDKEYLINNNGQNCRNPQQIWNSCNGINNNICLIGNTVFKSQAAVDSFLINHPYCNIFDGDICIGCDQNIPSDINNLEAFSNIDTINGSLTIINNAILENITGLHNLQSITGSITVINNDKLLDFDPISAINTTEIKGYILEDNAVLESGLNLTVTSVDGPLRITNNPKLGTLSITTTEVKGDFILEGNPLIANIGSTYPLTSVSGNIQLSDLSQWTNLSGFANMNIVQKDLMVVNCGINNLYGFQNLTKINGNLTISGNYNLEKLTDLLALKTVNGGINLADNSNLSDISGLDGVNYDLLGSLDLTVKALTISENTILEVCNTILVCKVVSENEKLYHIANNGGSCSSIEELNEECTVSVLDDVKLMKYQIYPNPMQDILTIKINQSTAVKVTNTDGRCLYNAYLKTGEHKLDVKHFHQGLYFIKFGNEYVDKIIKL